MVNVMPWTVLVLLAVEAPAVAPVTGLPLRGEAAVAFLNGAEVVGKPEGFDSLAITEPVRVTLSDGEQTLRAIFKDEETLYPRFRFGDGREADKVHDSYKHEIAAHELDRMLALDLVPACVERTLFSRRGALCLWVENAMTEADRRHAELRPPDWEAWGRRMAMVRAFQQLIADQDYSNIRNVLVDGNFRVYKVDSSMAFPADRRLLDEDRLTRFPESLLEALESLDRAEVDGRLVPWLTKAEIKALWARRDRILELAHERAAEEGGDADSN
jgi:hypothetical protein